MGCLSGPSSCVVATDQPWTACWAGHARRYRQRQERIVGEMAKITKARERILALIAKGILTDEQAEKQLNDLNRQEAKLTGDLERLQETLENVPSPETIKAVAEQVSSTFKKYTGGRRLSSARVVAKVNYANKALDAMTWDDKRTFVEMVFSGKTLEGKRMGVYVEQRGDRRRWQYAIHGHLINEQRHFP